MNELAQVSQFVAKYGYLAVFILVFLQEIGVPNPVTNELVLLYAGYLAYQGILNLWEIIIVTISADFIGTSLLYFVFYYGGKYIMTHKPKWLPISDKRIEKLKSRVSKGNRRGIFLGRLIPFLRGYVSVVAGLGQIKPKVFLTTVIISGVTWSGGLVFLGWLLAPYWSLVMQKTGIVENIVFTGALIIAIILLIRYFSKKLAKEEGVDS